MISKKTEDERLEDFIGPRRTPSWWRDGYSDSLIVAVVLLMAFMLWKQVTSRQVQTVFNVSNSRPVTS